MRAPLDRLIDHPYRFGFFQAVRLLVQTRPPEQGRSGTLLQAADMAVRLGTLAATAFPASEIQDMRPDGADGPLRMRVNFMGLTGPSGVLPLHYTEWLMQRRQSRDGGAAAFMDMFNHRALLLFWRAWARGQPAVMHELAADQGVMRHLYDLIGMGTRGLLGGPRRTDAPARPVDASGAMRETPPAGALGYYAGLIAQRPHGIAALARIVGDYCGARVDAEACVGTWQPVPPAQRTRLAAPSARLGSTALLGRRFWDRQSTLRLHIGPLDLDAFEALLPHRARLAEAVALARFQTGQTLDLRIRLRLAARAVPPLRLAGRTACAAPARLGWNTWLAGRRAVHAADDCEFSFPATGGPSWR